MWRTIQLLPSHNHTTALFFIDYFIEDYLGLFYIQFNVIILINNISWKDIKTQNNKFSRQHWTPRTNSPLQSLADHNTTQEMNDFPILIDHVAHILVSVFFLFCLVYDFQTSDNSHVQGANSIWLCALSFMKTLFLQRFLITWFFIYSKTVATINNYCHFNGFNYAVRGQIKMNKKKKTNGSNVP